MRQLLIVGLLAIVLLSLYGLVVRAGPKTPKVHYTYGLSYYEQGDFTRALGSFSEAIALEPGYADAYHGRGLVYLRQDEPHLALADFDLAIGLDPEPQYYFSRAGLYRQRGELELAIGDFTTVLSLLPEDVSTYIERGNSYFSQGNHQAATADYHSALRLDPQLAAGHYNLGLLAFDREDWDEAIRLFRRVIAIDESHFLAHCLLGQAYAYKGLETLADFQLGWGRRLLREQKGDLATFMRYSSFCLHPSQLD